MHQNIKRTFLNIKKNMTPKTKLTIILAFAMIGITSAWLQNNKHEVLSSLVLTNIEALAGDENSTGCSNHGPTEVSWWSGRYCKNTNSICCSY